MWFGHRHLNRVELRQRQMWIQDRTPATRQEDFDEQSTTDDHLMHLVGRARDTQGRPYFIIKNSWGDGNEYGGRQFVSMEYFRHHTIAIMLHRDGSVAYTHLRAHETELDHVCRLLLGKKQQSTELSNSCDRYSINTQPHP